IVKKRLSRRTNAARRRERSRPCAGASAEARGHLLAHALQGAHDLGVGDHAAAVELGQDAVEAELAGEVLEPPGHGVGRADDHLLAQHVLVADGLQRLAALGALLDGARAGPRRRFLELGAERAIELHDRSLGRGPCLGLRLADVDRHAQVHLALPGVAGGGVGLPVRGDVGAQLLDGAEPDGDEDRQPHGADRRVGVGAGGGDAHRRIRLLQRARHEREVAEGVELAFEGEALVAPRALENLQHLGEALAALRIGDAVALVGAREAAAADAEDQPSAADVVQRRHFLGEPHRVAQGQDLHGNADLEAACAGGDGAGEHEGGGGDGTFRGEVQLGQPHHVEPPALGGVDLLEGAGEGLRVALAGAPRKLVEDAELERHGHPRTRRAGRSASIMPVRDTPVSKAVGGHGCAGRSAGLPHDHNIFDLADWRTGEPSNYHETGGALRMNVRGKSMIDRTIRALAVALALAAAFAGPAWSEAADDKPARAAETDPIPNGGAAPDPLTPPEKVGPPPAAPGTPTAAEAKAAAEVDPIVAIVRQRLAAPHTHAGDADRADFEGLVAYYAEAGRAVWTSKDGFTRRAQ